MTDIKFDFWACPRPLTGKWGSGQVWDRICKRLGQPDVAFGKTDGIPDGVKAIDLNTGYDWKDLSEFEDNQFDFGYWDPPYFDFDKHPERMKFFRPEGMEIWRTVKRLAILHVGIWPRAWLAGAEREAMIAVTMGPMKQIRCLQVHRKSDPNVSGGV